MSKVDIKKFINNAPVGKIIKVRFKDGKNYELVKYHEGIIGTRDCPFSSRMNEDWSKEADWNTSDLKPKLEKWFKENAPEELVEICDVTIPSMTNIYGKEYKNYHHDDKNQFQFAYFKDWHNRIKTILSSSSNKEGWWYWTKSPRAGSSDDFCYVDSNGNAGYNVANDYDGVAPCFCLKGFNLQSDTWRNKRHGQIRASSQQRNMECPCKECKTRHVGCHGTCEKYKEWKIQNDELNKKARKMRESQYCDELWLEQHWKKIRRKS